MFYGSKPQGQRLGGQLHWSTLHEGDCLFGSVFLHLQNAYWGPVCISGSSPDLGSFVSWISCRVCICVWEVGGRREGGGQLLPCGWSMSVFCLTVSCCFSSDMVLKPRAAVSVTVPTVLYKLPWMACPVPRPVSGVRLKFGCAPWALPVVDLASHLLARSCLLCPPGLAFLFPQVSSLWLCSLCSPLCHLVWSLMWSMFASSRV